ncbi:MAG: diheme cytochrome c [Gammaproteobacteria bacterium]|nr:diheme cytochrome c [Gammaproteobacteria bacterium]
MKNTLAITAVIFTIGFVTLPIVWSDSDFSLTKFEDYERHSTGIAAVSNLVYQEECGSCHMAYPPGLLTSASWEKLMSELENHFGDNAELDNKTHQSISKFLLNNSSEQSNYRHSRKFSRFISAKNIPTRISKTPYFIHEHDEIPERMVTANNKVKSFSHCNACHTNAEKGSFNEHDIRIPGFGQWDD